MGRAGRKGRKRDMEWGKGQMRVGMDAASDAWVEGCVGGGVDGGGMDRGERWMREGIEEGRDGRERGEMWTGLLEGVVSGTRKGAVGSANLKEV